ncbi:MAG: hypothetical protein ACYDAG_04845 [Chloroflexota bacterium]
MPSGEAHFSASAGSTPVFVDSVSPSNMLMRTSSLNSVLPLWGSMLVGSDPRVDRNVPPGVGLPVAAEADGLAAEAAGDAEAAVEAAELAGEAAGELLAGVAGAPEAEGDDLAGADVPPQAARAGSKPNEAAMAPARTTNARRLRRVG